MIEDKLVDISLSGIIILLIVKYLDRIDKSINRLSDKIERLLER